MRGEILRYGLAGGGPGQIHHRPDQLPPSFASVSGASRNLIDLMARGARALRQRLAVSFRELSGLLLRSHRDDYKKRRCHNKHFD
jgi:hypothetical protein